MKREEQHDIDEGVERKGHKKLPSHNLLLIRNKQIVRGYVYK